MKFYHLSDIHLGAQPERHIPAASYREKEIWDSFEETLRRAAEEKVDAIFITGDLFHRQPLIQELREVDHLFASLGKIRVFLMAGNHDYYSEDSAYAAFTWSENVTFFKEKEKTVHVVPEWNLYVYGHSYHSREIKEAVYDSWNREGKDGIHIMMAHGGDAEHIPMNYERIASAGFDYVAMGHIHKPGAYKDYAMAYAGALEPIDRNDLGEHGYIKGQIEKGFDGRWFTRINFIPAAKGTYELLTIPLTDIHTDYELREIFGQKLSQVSKGTFVRVVLQGERLQEFIPDIERLKDIAADFTHMIVLEISDESREKFDYEQLRLEGCGQLIGFFLNSYEQEDLTPVTNKSRALGVTAWMNGNGHTSSDRIPGRYDIMAEHASRLILHELEILHFGHMKERRFHFIPGFNLIVGQNEAGKSTTVQLIRSMLYGMRRGKGRAASKDAYSRYSPWSGAQPGGRLAFSCDDRRFQLSRIFPDEVSLLCTDDGEWLDVAKGDLKVLLGGVTEGLFCNTSVMSYRDQAPEEEFAAQLENYLLNIEHTEEELQDMPKTLSWLKEQGKKASRRGTTLQKERELMLRFEQTNYEKYKQEEQELLHNKPADALYTQDKDWNKKLLLLFFIGISIGAMGIMALLKYVVPMLLFGTVMTAIFCILWKKDTRSREERKREAEILTYKQEQWKEELEKCRRKMGQSKESIAVLEIPSLEEEKCIIEAKACLDARERLKQAAEQSTGDWVNKLAAIASTILFHITDGRYKDIHFGTHFEITFTNGSRILTPEQVSYGTREQIWTAIRLAASDMLTDQKMPFLFDDTFLSWDEQRLLQLFRWLIGSGHQILYFCRGKAEEEILNHAGISYHKIILDEIR